VFQADAGSHPALLIISTMQGGRTMWPGMRHEDEHDPNCAAFYPPGLLDEAREALRRLADIGFRYDGLRDLAARKGDAAAAGLRRRLTAREEREKQEPLASLRAVHRTMTDVMRLDLRRAA
jgi:hypothetical protein